MGCIAKDICRQRARHIWSCASDAPAILENSIRQLSGHRPVASVDPLNLRERALQRHSGPIFHLLENLFGQS